jgi:hypothetical protein
LLRGRVCRMAERKRHAKVDVEYLLNDAGPEFLGDLCFEDRTPVYNKRDLRHMMEVERQVQTAPKAWPAMGPESPWSLAAATRRPQCLRVRPQGTRVPVLGGRRTRKR